MSIELDKERLLQEKTLQWIQHKLDMDEWVTVRQTPSDDSQGWSIYSTLIPLDKVGYQRSHLQDYIPPSGFVTTRFGPNRQQETTGIDRDRKGNQYLIIDRNPGKIEGKEICQDFRFFYNLHLNRDTGEYVLKDFDTKNEVVAVVEANSVKIRFKELHQFLKSKKLYLSLRFVCSEYSEHSLSELGVSENEVEAEEVDLQNGHISWRRFYCETHKDGYQTECSLEARRLIGYAEIPKDTYGFIVGVDKYGNEIRRHPNDLRVRIYEGLGWSPNPIFVDFKKTVLDKYYHNPNKYTVGDCLLTLHNGEVNTPRLPFDDDHEHKVRVLFYYLVFLPDEDMAHWQMHSIRPEGQPSETYINRYAPGRIATESNRPEHRFRNRYSALSQLCNTRLGWNLLLPLRHNDEYRLRCLRVPSSDEQSEFDELVQNLATILIDSLNQKDIKTLLSDEELSRLDQEKEYPKGIDYFEAALCSWNVANTQKHISFLRKLQSLRSVGSAHRKGKKYEKQLKKDFGIENQEYRQGFESILRQAVECLEFLARVVNRGELLRKRQLPLLYDLNRHLHTLLQTLFPSETEGVFTDEPWMNERGLMSRDIAHELMVKVVPKFDSSPSEFVMLCEDAVTSMNPDVNPSDIKDALTDTAKVFISEAGSNLNYGINLFYQAQSANMQLTKSFEYVVGNAAYSKKLVAYSRVLIKLDEVRDCAWYPYYVAQYLSYASAYTLYAYEHVLHAEGLDSVPVILDAISAVQGAADTAEKIVNVDAIRETAKNLTQVAKCGPS